MYILSYEELTNTEYGFNGDGGWRDQTRQPKNNTSGTYYWVRTPGQTISCVSGVPNTGYIDPNGGYPSFCEDWSVNHAQDVRPVIRIKADALNGCTINEENITIHETTWDCVSYGIWEGKPIVWRVLSIKDNNAFLLSDKILFEEKYGYTNKWDECYLRKHLNKDFYNTAFSSTEQENIIETIVENPDNTYTGEEGGEDTKDKVFLLSLYEASNNEYGFPSSCNAESLERNSKNLKGKDSWWWLRSPSLSDCTASVCSGGDIQGIDNSGQSSTNTSGIRPCIHINLDSECWKYLGTVSSITGADFSSVEHIHDYKEVPDSSKTPTCIKDGKEADKKCSVCGDVITGNTIKAAGHKWDEGTFTKEATETETGIKTYTCTVCKETKTEIIPKKSVEDKKDEKTDNTQTPTPTPEPQKPSDTTSMTTPTAKVKAPEKVTIKSVKNEKSKKLTAKWKKVKDAKGYQIEYALNNKFTKSRKSKTIKGNTSKSLTYTAKNLKKSKVYYVRVRAYKTDAKGKKVYGKWSTIKKVTIKK